MTNKRIYRFIPVLIFAAFGFFACNVNDSGDDMAWDVKKDKIISEWLAEKEELSISLEALQRVYIYNTISTYGPYTFFVPNNDAWSDYFNLHNHSSLKDVDDQTLEEIFEYHILPVLKMTETFENGIMNEQDTTVNGDRLLLDISNGLDQVLINNRSEIVESDIEAWNGVIHVVDQVLEPPRITVGEYLEGNSEFSSFVQFLKNEGVFDTLLYRRTPIYPYSRNEFSIIALTNAQMETLGTYIDSLTLLDARYFEEVARDPEYANRVSPNLVRELAGSFIISGLEYTSTAFSGFKKTLGRVPYGDGFLRIKMVVGEDLIHINDQATINLAQSDLILKNGLVHRVNKAFVFLSESPRDLVYSAYPVERWNTTQGASVLVNSTSGYMGDDANIYGIVNLEPKLVGSEFWIEIRNVPAGKYNLALIVKKQGSKAKILVDDKLMEFPGTAADGSYDFSLLLGNRGTVDDLNPTALSATGLNLFVVNAGSFEVQNRQELVSVKFSTTYINPGGARIGVSAFVLEPFAE